MLWHIGVSNSTPDLQRSHTLVLRSFHSRSQLLRDLVLWHFGVSNHCSGSSKHSHPCSHSPCMAGIHLLFFCSQQLIYIWDTPTLTKPGVVFQKNALFDNERQVVSTSSHNLQEYSFTQLHILGDSQFPLSSSLFTLKPRVETKEYSHPPWMGLLQPVQVKRFDQNRSSCAEMSVVRTIHHRRILDK